MNEDQKSADQIISDARSADAEALSALEDKGRHNALSLDAMPKDADGSVDKSRRSVLLGLITLGSLGAGAGVIAGGVVGNAVYDGFKKAYEMAFSSDLDPDYLGEKLLELRNVISGIDKRTLVELRSAYAAKNSKDRLDAWPKLIDVFIQRSSGIATHDHLKILTAFLDHAVDDKDKAFLRLHRARVRAFVANDSATMDDIQFATEKGDEFVAVAAIMERINYAQLMVDPDYFETPRNWYSYAISFKQLSERAGRDYAFNDVGVPDDRKLIERQAIVSRFPGVGAHIGFFAGQYEIMMSSGKKREASWSRSEQFLRHVDRINSRLAFNHAAVLAFIAAQLGDAGRVHFFIRLANEIVFRATTKKTLKDSGLSLAQFALFKVFEARFLHNEDAVDRARRALFEAATLTDQVGHPAFHAALNRASRVIGDPRSASANEQTLAHARGGYSTGHTWSYIYFPRIDIT
jgi:hypothetical protein